MEESVIADGYGYQIDLFGNPVARLPLSYFVKKYDQRTVDL
jgi:hypothetical protein